MPENCCFSKRQLQLRKTMTKMRDSCLGTSCSHVTSEIEEDDDVVSPMTILFLYSVASAVSAV